MNLVKPAAVLALYGVLMHEIGFNMAARRTYLCIQNWWKCNFKTFYFKNLLTDQHEILIMYWYQCEGVSFQISHRSEIQYGRQGAILDFLSDIICQEPFEQSF